MRHTPGPWRISEKGPLDCLRPTRETCIEIAGDSMCWIAQVLRNHGNGGDGEANARLIAAAPEGYELAKLVLPLLEGTANDVAAIETLAGYVAGLRCQQMIKLARAIIAKVDGKQ